jgi:DNA-directed RNA polymerase subunit RPC12/RpoP
MTSQVFVAWLCMRCEVAGRDIEAAPSCWNCGSKVTVTARPTILIHAGVGRTPGSA